MCGEKIVDGFHRYTVMGSPLRVRGKVAQDRGHAVRAGITPARAGKSVYIDSISQPARDHPRLCGEKGTLSLLRARNIGSPPPVRGKVKGGRRGRRNLGITPACAGKSPRRRLRPYQRSDHPRLCGEKRPVPEVPALQEGSPPPVRGKARGQCYFADLRRITPACAGKSRRSVL